MGLKKFVPAPIRALLRPYKMKLQRMRMLAALEAASAQVAPDPELLGRMRAFSRKYGTAYLPAMLARGWCEPGHMFDEIGEIFSANNKLFLVGTHADVERLTRKLAFIGVEIESMSLSRPCKRDLAWLAGRAAAGCTVIIGYEDAELGSLVMDRICQYGKHFRNVNIFHESDFIDGYVTGPEVYCGIFSVYASDKVYIPHNNILVTTVCNLNCEYCLNYTPYNKNPKHFELDELKKNIDIYFSKIDRVGLFQLSGGEPLLYPYLKEILEYILNKYKEKIDILNLVTNGTIVPDDEFLKFCKHNDIFIYLDDYTNVVINIKQKFSQTIKKFNESGVKYCHLKVPEFFITFPPIRMNFNLDGLKLQEKFRKCYIGVQNIRDGKICSCTYHAFAVNAGLIPDASDNWFDMTQMGDGILDKRKLVEFRLRFNQKGYVDWCRYCNGHISINPLRSPAAKQAKGRLDWDINNPTFLD